MNNEKLKEFTNEFINIILKKKINNINNLKKKLAYKYKLKKIPKNTIILAYTPQELMNKVSKILENKPTRKLSGVSVVALFAKPHSCPHGRCIYCPGGPKSYYGDTPQSYTGKEPAAMRAIFNNYDPYLQVFNRLEHYIINGHFPNKIETIIMGGTFPALPKLYRDEFINFLYKAFNDFGDEFFEYENNEIKINYNKFIDFFELPSEFNDPEKKNRIHKKILQLKNKNVKDYKQEIKRNETAKIRCIGLTIESRPDWAFKEHCLEMLNYGATRFEVGVQILSDEILKKIKRGHNVEDIAESFQILRDLCFKINAHMMIGLPYSNKDIDINSFKMLFEDKRFKPDMLKIYPCLLVKGTELYDLYKKGIYKPITTKEAAEIISEIFKYIPKYVRVMRVQRDIPTNIIERGVKNSNLRQYVENIMKEKGIKSKDIREKEVGFRLKRGYKLGAVDIKVSKYYASNGKEYFISVEDENKTLVGFVRLRIPFRTDLIKEINEETALIRELHVYGNVVPIGFKGSIQHKGWGKKLMKKAEEIAKKEGCKKIAVISGVGVREYYKKLGYKLENRYMTKYI